MALSKETKDRASIAAKRIFLEYTKSLSSNEGTCNYYELQRPPGPPNTAGERRYVLTVCGSVHCTLIVTLRYLQKNLVSLPLSLAGSNSLQVVGCPNRV